ncbi:MAG TPA: putative metal-dependent hydrolase [Chitinophagaceae bacterium]|jgi:hypothetical protein|nr:putative metal-dependent hydrolase [Chitinophagaceae bacterium]
MSVDPQRYPIGECKYPELYTPELLKQYKLAIETFPMRLEHIVQHLDIDQLNKRYREGGWTVNQVIHHCADSHMNCVMRIKFALTEQSPEIKPYDEAAWAETADYDLPFNNSITLLFAVHRKIMKLIDSLNDEQLNRTYYHNQYKRTFSIKDVICLYAWHGNHHLAHIQNAIA